LGSLFVFVVLILFLFDSRTALNQPGGHPTLA